MKPSNTAITVVLTITSLLSACGRTTELGSDHGSGASSSGGAAPGGNGGTGNGAAGNAGSGGEPVGTRFWEDAESNALCPTEGRPSKDQRPQSDGGTKATIYLVMNHINLGGDDGTGAYNENAWKSIGFNLDLSCNKSSWPDGALSADQADACYALANETCLNAYESVWDGDNCRDNTLGQLFYVLGVSPVTGDPFRLTSDDFNCALHRGSMGIVFKVSDYNGLPNDDAVRLDVYSSVGVTEPASWRCRKGDASSDSLDPNWVNRGDQPITQTFQVADRDIRQGANAQPPGELPESKWADASAFVRSGWLIAELPPATEIWFNGLNAHTAGIRLVLERPLIAARLEQTAAGRWEIPEATLGSAVKPGAMIDSLREIGFCENLCDSYTTTLSYLEQSQDMLSNTNDVVPGANCDALSFGAQFTALQYHAFEVVDVLAPPDVSGGKCGTPRNPDIPTPGCTCAPDGSGCN